jgi:hypothetical protein
MEEIWKPVVGYEGHYEVSSHGRVRSLDRRCTYKPSKKNGKVRTDFLIGRMCKQIDQGYYFTVWLHKEGSRRFYVHRLVLEAFVGSCPTGMECRHLDGNSRNNYAVNLAWGTHDENEADKTKHGTRFGGDTHPMRKISSDLVKEIRRRLSIGERQKDIAEDLELGWRHVGAIARREIWKNV